MISPLKSPIVSSACRSWPFEFPKLFNPGTSTSSSTSSCDARTLSSIDSNLESCTTTRRRKRCMPNSSHMFVAFIATSLIACLSFLLVTSLNVSASSVFNFSSASAKSFFSFARGSH
ncbi:hypothetical protein BDZ45DRAFT_363423 [Acephala macrosclerotiorum]|nr:hypothetical protein BDZ45DRAFT_363423 [Acephala macrosclerotiorum]